MIQKVKEKPTLVIAGPGAGKTYNMVDQIIQIMPYLSSHRILAAITFTNAAADSIKESLKKKIQISPNVFVGTNYSFFNQFIFLPFAPLYGLTPFSEKVFLDVDFTPKSNDPAKRIIIRRQFYAKLLKEGKVPFGEIARISAKLMEFSRVREVVCNRIQFLFSDEFQDTDTQQLKIFEAFRKVKKTVMYSVGDPEQYILGFTYNQRGMKSPSFDSIPIKRFATQCNQSKNSINKRACKKLVEFTNNFHTSINQVSSVDSNKGTDNSNGVFFIEDTDLDAVISKFINLTQPLMESNRRQKRLFLGYENNTFAELVDKYGLASLSNENSRPKSILQKSLDLITSAVQLSSSNIKEKYNLDSIELRKLGIKLLKAIISGQIHELNELILFINKGLYLQCKVSTVRLDNKLEGLCYLLNRTNHEEKTNFHSSIHKAKGLEADFVLAVAKDTKELKKWLETEYNKRCEDKRDTCRIGYVAFTRAKKVLCLACKEPIDETIRSKLSDLKAPIK